MNPTNTAKEPILERVRQFKKKGEIKRRIIQGEMELAYDMAEIATEFERLHTENKELKRKTAYMCQDGHKAIYHQDEEWCPLCRANGKLEIAKEALGQIRQTEQCKLVQDITSEALSKITPST